MIKPRSLLLLLDLMLIIFFPTSLTLDLKYVFINLAKTHHIKILIHNKKKQYLLFALHLHIISCRLLSPLRVMLKRVRPPPPPNVHWNPFYSIKSTRHAPNTPRTPPPTPSHARTGRWWLLNKLMQWDRAK